ncbi:MAG: hypothetical protein AAFQ79_07730 [Pseudomonadota bacterium]
MILNTNSFQRGQNAAQSGQPMSANPFSDDTTLHADWELGWRVATKMQSIQDNNAVTISTTEPSAFAQGQLAAARDQSASANPYTVGHPAHDEWRLGWARAKSH